MALIKTEKLTKAKFKSTVNCKNCSCVYISLHSCTHNTAVLQTVVIARMLSTGGRGMEFWEEICFEASNNRLCYGGDFF